MTQNPEIRLSPDGDLADAALAVFRDQQDPAHIVDRARAAIGGDGR